MTRKIIGMGMIFAIVLSGCKIKMTTTEILGNKDTVVYRQDNTEQERVTEEDLSAFESTSQELVGKTMSEEAESEASTEKLLKRTTFQYSPLSEENIKKALAAVQEEEDIYQLFVDGMYVDLCFYEYGSYKSLLNFGMIQSFLNDSKMNTIMPLGDGAYYRRTHFRIFSEESGTDPEKAEGRAESKVMSFLRELGYQIGDIYSCYLSVDELSTIREQMYQREYADREVPKNLPWEESGVYFFAARQSAKGTTVEDYNGESLITAVYSVSLEKVIEFNTSIPPILTSIREEKTNSLITDEEALLLGDAVLSGAIFTGYTLLEPELVYAHARFGSMDTQTQTIQLFPAWKIRYEVKVGNQMVEDYILMDAETGSRLTNATPLY